MADPILTIGDLEPDRPTIRIFRSWPANRWEEWKANHLPAWALRLMPVRLERRPSLYPLHHPSEFALADVARIQAAQREMQELQLANDDPAAVDRTDLLLRELSGVIVDAPAAVLDELTGSQHIQILMSFPIALEQMGPAPSALRRSLESSYPGSAPSTARTTG